MVSGYSLKISRLEVRVAKKIQVLVIYNILKKTPKTNFRVLY